MKKIESNQTFTKNKLLTVHVYTYYLRERNVKSMLELSFISQTQEI